LLYVAASAAAVRLERLLGYEGRRIDSRASLTLREQSVLRHASLGEIIARKGEGTRPRRRNRPQSLQKGQAKLGTRNRTHTAAEAMRDLLIV
jgi:hypothetical protein